LTAVWASAVALAAAGAASATIPARRHRSAALLGLLAGAFGLASAAVAARASTPPSALEPTSLAIDAGCVTAGVLLVLWAAVRSWMALPPRVIGPVALAASAVVLGWLARGLILAAGWTALLAALPIACLVIGLAAAGSLPGRSGHSHDDRAVRNVRPATRARAVAIGLGTVLAIAGPNVWLIVAGALLAAAAVSPLLVAVAAVGLIPSLWFMWTVAGPVGLRTATLASIPLSPAAEAMIAPALALGAVGFFGLWPLRRWGSPLLLPVGAALLLRLGAAAPDGLQSWETVLVPLGVIGLGHALLAAEPDETIGAATWLAAVTGGVWAAALLAAAGAIRELIGVAGGMPVVARRVAAMRCVSAAAWGLVAAGAALALRSLLGAEVVYGVITTLLAAALIGRLQTDAR
jgi:hypothetical protein